MRYHLIKNKLLSTLLVFALLFTLLPATAWAAAATGTASGTAGYNNIAVSLSGASQFAADAATVQNTSNWELTASGAQTILGITKHDTQYVSIVLSAPIQAGQTFTIDAATEVFAPETDMFLAPLDVNITIPTPATGTAEAIAGVKDIAVALTTGTFGSESAVETKSFWTLGGASASENPIASVTYLDSAHATVTLTNNIGASDTYTITAAQFVFVNAAIAPFASPLSVMVEPAGPAAPLTLVSAAVTAEGGVGLTFDKELSPTDLATKVNAGFTVHGLEATPKTITNVTLHSVSGGTNNFVQLYLDPTVKGGEAASLTYTPRAPGVVQSLDGGTLEEIVYMEISNGLPYPDLVTTAPPAATVGSAYTHTLTASGGTAPYTFSIDDGVLPSGLTMSSTGVISGTPTVAASFTFFVMVEDANQALDIEGFSITVNTPSANVCEIGGTQYTTLDAALATINDGETKTITLLKNIDYDKGITLINKKITFALNGYTLNVVNTAEHGYALAVSNGGCVYLSGTGALNVTGPARGYGVTVASNGASSEVTVTSATGIGTESKAAHAYNKASLTVLGDVTATGIGSFGVHAQAGAVVEVRGNVSADNQGICVSDATAKVTGNVQSNGNDLIGNPEGIGVNVYNGVAEIGGNVTANRVGAMIYAGGSITLDGTLTAPDYIQFADDAPTAIGGYLAKTTKPGYRTYQHATAGTIWVKGETPATTYALTITNGTGGGSYAKDAVVAITANPAPGGQRFKEWSIAPSVTFSDSTNKNSQTAKFIMPAQPVAATAIYEVLPASEYTITVQNDGNGTTSVNFNSAAEGAEITLTATPNSGYRFKEWQVISGGVTVVNNKFSMLDSNVTVKAIFEPIPASSYNVVVNGSYAGVSGAGSYAKDATITIHAGSRSSYSFTGWTSPDGVAFVNAGSATTTFTMPAKNVTVTTNWSYDGGGGGGTTIPKYEASVSSGSGSVYVEAKVNTNNASAELTPAQVAKGKDISVTMPKIPDVKSYTLGIPVPSLSDASGKGSVTLNTGAGNITLPSNMLGGTDAASGSKAQISIGTVKPGDLPKDAQDKVGTRPIVSLSLSIDSKAVAWNNPNAPVTVSIPYTPMAEELKSSDRITVWYIDGSGNFVEMRDAKYDPATGTVVFQTTHFSFYAVGYKAPADSAKFTDVLTGAWYYDAVTFIAEKGITTGTGGGKFSPEATLTRGQFIVMLMKAYGIEAEMNPTDNFSDAGNTYYTSYLAAAKAKGISSGIGNNKFGPEQAITRQEMFTLLYNALKLLNKLPAGDNGKTIANFTDSGSVESWATEALTALVKSGTVSGSSDRLDPTATTTRAQMAQVLYNLLGK